MATEREAYIVLNRIEDIGPVTVRTLAHQFGSVAAILEASEADLTAVPGVGPETAWTIVKGRNSFAVEAELERAEAEGVRIVTPVDEEYPAPLREIHDPPLALYVRGTLQSRDVHALGVVGTRRPSHYGRACAETLASQLVRTGWVVVSGLAVGIDTAAHRGALKAGGRTLAVLGAGLDHLFPPENRELADQISQQGAVLTEYPFGRPPDRTTFPVRNRIISGLSRGVLVVEAGETSGALHTAHQALEQGRTVFAVPGRIDSPTARGTHRLIKQGAKLVEHVDDILQEFEFLLPPHDRRRLQSPSPSPPLTEEEQRFVQALEDGEQDVDTLIRKTGIPAAAVQAMLVGLEMKRVIRMLPGRRVERVR